MFHYKELKAESKAGQFFIGDPCEIMSPEVFNKIWVGEFKFLNGEFTVEPGVTMAISGTNGLCGCFKTSFGCDIYTGSGSIGLIPKELWDSEKASKFDESRFIFAENLKSLETYDGFEITAINLFKNPIYKFGGIYIK